MKISKRFKKTYLTFTVLLTFIISMSQFASAAVEHSFGVNHPSITWTDTFDKQTWIVSPLDNRTTTSYVHNKLVGMGYSNTSTFINDTASTLQSAIGGDAVFYSSCHGSQGLQTCANSTSSGWDITYLTANSTSNTRGYSLQNKYGTSKLSNVKFAYYDSCDSADTSSVYGNLLDTSYGLGVTSSLGFLYTINAGYSDYFAQKFFDYAANSKTISECATSAMADTFSAYSGYGGVNSYVIAGSTSLKLK